MDLQKVGNDYDIFIPKAKIVIKDIIIQMRRDLINYVITNFDENEEKERIIKIINNMNEESLLALCLKRYYQKDESVMDLIISKLMKAK